MEVLLIEEEINREDHMCLARKSFVFILLLMVGFGSTVDAAVTKQKAIVKFVTGEVLYQKKSQGSWKKVKVGSKISEQDMIRTFVESNAQLLLASGSQLTVEENTIVKMAELVQDGQATNTNVNIKKGRVLFNIKKLAERKSTFKFETLTATAAIRGTQGGIGFTGKRAYAYLDEGKLELRSTSGRKVDVNPRDFVIQKADGFEKKVMESQEDLKKFLQELNKESEETDITKIDSTISDSIVIDTTTIDTAETEEEGESALSGTINSYPPQVMEPTIQLSGTCTGTGVMVGSQAVKVQNGSWQTQLTWNPSETGLKSFPVVCSDEQNKVEIGVASFVFGAEMTLNLQTPEVVDIKNGVLSIRGTYTGSPKAQLFVTVEGKTVDISNKSQFFSYVLAVTDRIGNWNMEEAILTLKDEGKADIVKKISITVDKTSKAVNTLPPKLSVMPNFSTGEVVIIIGNGKDDIIKYAIRSDEGTVEEETDKDIRYKYNLIPGEHSYDFTAVDLAGNETKVSLPNIQYWPPVNFSIELRSDSRDGEIIPLPPRLPNLRQRQIPKERIEVRIENLPNDDYRFIKRVTIENSAANFREVYENTRLEQNNRYELEVNLAPRKTNTITVKVEPQKGSYKVVTKTIILK